ncbi:MAG: response regulator transcription factor [Dehalococcoidales bacterium]|jgi:two-component system OmpR family response regulator/two-component system copper resistance phosphate regulon response regulator CusR|nr:response regulator transcription factor [Dehalococcoidales bacterium]MDX9803256.1 response regulator transcription factor [Dehalococcoidales bacterium]
MKILLVEDDQKLCQLLSQGLWDEGHTVEVAHDGEWGSLLAKTSDYDLIMLDVMLPGDLNGVDVCRLIRQEGITTPVFMLTAKKHITDRVAGLDAGADDYLCKPFSIAELKARIRSLQRRRTAGGVPEVVIYDATIDTTTRSVKVKGKPVDLAPLEYRALECFISHSGKVVARTRLEEYLWGDNTEKSDSAIESLIKRLRCHLGWDVKEGPLVTVRGEGYRLKIK